MSERGVFCFILRSVVEYFIDQTCKQFYAELAWLYFSPVSTFHSFRSKYSQKEIRKNIQIYNHRLFVELVFRLVLLDVVLVSRLKVFRQHDVPGQARIRKCLFDKSPQISGVQAIRSH